MSWGRKDLSMLLAVPLLLAAGAIQASVPASVKGPLRAPLERMEKVCMAEQWADCHLVRYDLSSQMVTIPDEEEWVVFVFKNNDPASRAYYQISQDFQTKAEQRGTYDQFVGKFKPLQASDELFSESGYFEPIGDDAYKYFAQSGMQDNLKQRGIRYDVQQQAFRNGRLETLRMVALTYAMRREPATVNRALTLMRQFIHPGSKEARQYNALRSAMLAYMK